MDGFGGFMLRLHKIRQFDSFPAIGDERQRKRLLKGREIPLTFGGKVGGAERWNGCCARSSPVRQQREKFLFPSTGVSIPLSLSKYAVGKEQTDSVDLTLKDGGEGRGTIRFLPTHRRTVFSSAVFLLFNSLSLQHTLSSFFVSVPTAAAWTQTVKTGRTMMPKLTKASGAVGVAATAPP